MQIKIGVLADDLSGGNGIGVEFAGFQMKTVMVQEATALPKLSEDIDVIIFDTESRNDPEDLAYQKNYEASLAVKALNPEIVVKKIDSLLRGSIGQEIDAVMKVFSFEKCLFIAASPKIARITIGGYQLVNGNLLAQQRELLDPSSKVKSSYIPSILSAQTRKKIHLIKTEIIVQGKEAIKDTLRRTDAEIIVTDSILQQHLDTVVMAAYETGIRFFAGSYGLGQALYSIHMEKVEMLPILIVAGSLSDMTHKQADRLEREVGCKRVVIEYNEQFFDKTIEQFATNYAKQIEEYLNQKLDVVLHISTPHEQVKKLWNWAQDKGFDLNYVSDRIEQLIQVLVKPILPKCSGFIFSGGATANAVFKLLDANGLNLTGQEVLPATPVSTIYGGRYDGIPYLTKPGSYGSEDDLVTMLKFLKNENHRKPIL